MSRTIPEQIAHLHLRWHACMQDGRDVEAAEIADEVQRLSDRVSWLARQRNEAVKECGVS